MVDRATPVPAPNFIAEYTEEPMPSKWGWTTLYWLDLQQTLAAMKHQDVQKNLMRLAEDDTIEFDRIKEYTTREIANGRAWQDFLLGVAGNQFPLVGLIGTTLLGGMAGTAYGTRKKRPGDLDPIEVENEKTKAVKDALTLNLGGHQISVTTPAQPDNPSA